MYVPFPQGSDDRAPGRLGYALADCADGWVRASSAVTQAAIPSATSAALAVLVSNDGVTSARSHEAKSCGP